MLEIIFIWLWIVAGLVLCFADYLKTDTSIELVIEYLGWLKGIGALVGYVLLFIIAWPLTLIWRDNNNNTS